MFILYFQRYRRQDRTAKSALMDRVEETVTAKWSKEKMDRLVAEDEQRRKERGEREQEKIRKQIRQEEKRKEEKRHVFITEKQQTINKK